MVFTITLPLRIINHMKKKQGTVSKYLEVYLIDPILTEIKNDKAKEIYLENELSINSELKELKKDVIIKKENVSGETNSEGAIL